MRTARLRGRVDELWAHVAAVAAGQGGNGNGQDKQNTNWAVVDEEGLKQITKILSEQQAGLTYVMQVMKEMQTDLAVSYGEASAWTKKEEADLVFDNPAASLMSSTLWGSTTAFSPTSTLRTSSIGGMPR